MASGGSVSIYFKLALFLITTAFLSVTALYFDLRMKHTELQQQVETLKASQVLLVVPDEQAKALSEWLNSHPESIDSLVKQGQRNAQPEKQSEAEPASERTKSKINIKPSQAAKKDDFSSDEIKIYQLPHGGIRVTTRIE